MNICEQFEVIWPVPDGVWFEGDSYRAGWDETEWRLAADFNIRLDTFTRCQETTDVYVSIIDEMIRHMGIINETSTDLRAIGIARESVGLAKQKMERVK